MLLYDIMIYILNGIDEIIKKNEVGPIGFEPIFPAYRRLYYLRPVTHDLPFLVCGKDVRIPALKSPAQSYL